MEAKLLPIAMIEPNEGQIKGLPRNPRFIRDERYEKLKQSIQEAPEMLEMRQLIAVEHGKKVVAICGNMRLRACLELGYTELPCYVLPKNTPASKLREYTIKDNIGYGQTDWGAIAAEWDTSELDGWGMEVDGFWDNSSGEQQVDDFFSEIGDDYSVRRPLKISVEISGASKELYDEIKEAVRVAVEQYDSVKVL